VLLAASARLALGDDAAPGGVPGVPRLAAADPSSPRGRSAAMTARVDQALGEIWAAAGIEPVGLSSDAEFLRRSHLDLTGRIPRVAEIREFLAGASPDKRAVVIERLLASPRHGGHLANLWLRMLLPDDVDMPQENALVGFRDWLRQRFVANLRYDNLVAEILVSQGGGRDPGPALFFTSLDLKPEEIASRTSRIFLGVQIQCAQCHDHPFQKWKQTDFWGYAAFFARLRRADMAPYRMTSTLLVDAHEGEVMIPDTSDPVPPKYLEGPLAEGTGTRRQQLAIWLASNENPYFARAAVNRVWAMLFGRGLVEPIDDLFTHQPTPNSQLLDELAAYFVSTGYDLRDLFRTLANTRAYQLTSRSENEADVDKELLFARMAIKNLTADQLYDCVQAASALRTGPGAQRSGDGNVVADPGRDEFVSRFRGGSENITDFQAGIPQALTLMNGRTIADATSLSSTGVLAAVDAPFFSDEDKIETLFLATLSRLPQPAERKQFMEHVSSRANSDEKRKALGDVLWALLNSAEFVLNH
jgi:hypothetical protein